MKYKIEIDSQIYEVEVTEKTEGNEYHIRVEDKEFTARLKKAGAPKKRLLKTSPITTRATPAAQAQPTAPNGQPASAEGNVVQSPMAGRIIRINVKPGDRVAKGQLIFILEAMKMENEILSPYDGVVAEIFVAEGASVGQCSPLCRIE